MRIKSSLEKTLKKELKKAGLPNKPEQLIGKAYLFESENGSHYHLLVGAINAIYLSDEQGLIFQVSNSTIWGKPLAYICYENGKWAAVTNLEIPKDLDEAKAEQILSNRYHYGNFQLLKTP